MRTIRLLTTLLFIPVLLALACGTSNSGNSLTEEQSPPTENQAIGNNDKSTQSEGQQEPTTNTSDTEEETVAEDTNTPAPLTPEPTLNPNLISSGTYLVGTDIQPGMYRGFAGTGFFGSCYWERLSGLSGEFDDIITNDGPNGQFYVEVFETDKAFKVDCEVEYLETLPEPLAEFPNSVPVGAYLVGIEIAPGLYRGQAGLNILDSCYWERLSGFSGEFDDIITNDGPNGQFYVEVLETDNGFSVDCEVEYLATLPTPLTEFPTMISPGTYLVGIDIAPGTYRGEAGEDILESCYWERLSGLTGEFNDIITNDGRNGQFYIQVSPSDFALKTGCELEYTGN